MEFTYYDAKLCEVEEPKAKSSRYRFYHCQICKLLLKVPLNPYRLAVVCTRCLEATPILKPPIDKKFYRCVCDCLILAPKINYIFICPRTSCHAVLVTEYAKRHPQLIKDFMKNYADNLKFTTSLPNISSLGENYLYKSKEWRTVTITCGYCKNSFKADDDLDLTAEIICPACENVSALTPTYARRICRSYILYGLLVIIFSSALSASYIRVIYAYLKSN